MSEVLEVLELDHIDPEHFTGHSIQLSGGRPVFGGQLLGQLVILGAAFAPDKFVRTVQAVFPRPGKVDAPLDFSVQTIHSGRTMATLAVDVSQAGKTVCRAQILLDTEEPDVMRFDEQMPTVGGPADAVAAPEQMTEAGSELRFVDGVDLNSAAASGPAELLAWVRWPSTPPQNRAINHAVGAWYTDSLLIGASMRPHEGVGGSMAHETISTGVITHTLTFHAPFDAAEWHLLVNESTFSGGGRTYGNGRLYTADGRLVASFAQDGMVRYFPAHVQSRGATTGVM